MANRKSKQYTIKLHFEDAKEDFGKILEYHFLLLIKILRNE